MKRIASAILLCTCCLFASCTREQPSPRDVATPNGDTKPTPPVTVVDSRPPVTSEANDPSKAIDAILANLGETNKQEQYDAALLKALSLLSEKKYAEALATLETARSLRDGEQIQGQIERVRALLGEQDSAQKTVQDIRAVLNDGRADEAAKLTTAALSQFGGSDAAEDLAKLKRQADALSANPGDDQAARRNLFLQEALAAMKDNNLRNAAIAYEQVLQIGDDANLRKNLDDVRAKLTRYDDGRRRAAELRRDPANLEDALAALRDAREAWDTPQIRAEMDECQLWLEKRRDRVSVADFEVRGDVGLALAGRTVAETILPSFKSKFDLVEREQLCKVLDELKLEGTVLTDHPDSRQAVGRLVKVRYLVVGSLTALNGVTLNARLVDVQTGLIVQTARYCAPTMDVLLAKLPFVAQMLLMTDDQKLALDQQFALSAAPEIKPVVFAELPPPPLVVVNEPPPPPIITYTPRPPVFVGVVIDDFRRPPPVIEVEIRRDDPRRQRLFQLSIELGDNLFRRGRYKEAHRHFELALTLTDDRRDVEVRLGRCRPLLPPPPVVVVVAPPVRPRAIVFNFFVNCKPGLVPPAVGDWAADNFASYLGGSFEIVERGEVCWYMGRLGITMRDVMNDAIARRSLAQALNVRFMVFSAVEETHSLSVTTQLVDADTGARTGIGSIHVQDQDEMKLRMKELANQLAAPKEQQALLAKQGQDNEKALNEARRLQKAGENAKAAQVAREALKQDPSNVALQQLAQDNDRLAQQAAADAARRKDAERRLAEAQAAQKHQAELAQQAEAARLRAEQEAKSRTEAAKREQEAKRQRAYDQLMAQGRDAEKRNDFTVAVQSFQSATALKPSDDGFKELAQAKAKQDQAAHIRAAEEQGKRDVEVKKQRDAEIARAELERKKKEADDAVKRKAQEDHDKAEVARLLGVAKDQLAKQQFDAARGTVQTARQIHPSPEIDAVQHLIQEQQDLADAKKKGEQAKLDLEKKQAEERKQRELADAEAKKKQDAYAAALKQAQDAVAAKQYDKAIAAYQEAGKLFKTDVVLSGERQAVELRDREKAQADAVKKQQEEDAKRTAQVKQLLADGQKALDAKQFEPAIAKFKEASKLAPGNVEVLTAVSKAEQARDQFAAANRTKLEDDKKAAFNKMVTDGKTALAAKRYDDAVKSFADAVHAQPQDATAQDLLRQAEKARGDAKQAATDAETVKKKKADYDLAMSAGQAALKQKNYQGAVNSFNEALRIQPGDAMATAQLKDADKQMKDAAAVLDAEAKRKAEEAKKRQADYQNALQTGRAALQAKKFEDAIKAFNDALKIMPNDKDATALVKEAEKDKADASKPPPPNNAAEYKKQMDNGAALEKQKKFADALTAYREALKLMPGDAKATAAAKTAQFELHVVEGQRLIDAKKFPDAVKELEEATKLFPDNADAKNLLKKAKDGK